MTHINTLCGQNAKISIKTNVSDLFHNYGSFNDTVSSSYFTAFNDKMIMNNELKELGRKRSWPTFRRYPGICLERLKISENLRQDSRRPGISEALPLEARCPVRRYM
jgi:hypothetical protein